MVRSHTYAQLSLTISKNRIFSVLLYEYHIRGIIFRALMHAALLYVFDLVCVR